MRLSSVKIGQLYTLNDNEDATLYEAIAMDGFTVAIKEQGHRYGTTHEVDCSVLQEPTRRQMENAR